MVALYLGDRAGDGELTARLPGGDDPLSLKTAVITLAFGITEQGTISVGAQGELTEDIANTLRIELRGATSG